MSIVIRKVGKKVQISADRAQPLAQLAHERATTEDALIEESLDLLFREQASHVALETRIDEDRAELEKLEAELVDMPPIHRKPIDLDGAVFIVGTPIPPGSLRRIENVR